MTRMTLLGGDSASFSISDIYPVTISVNQAFQSGVVSTFAQTQLVNGSCP